jgi:hypothetical protein
MEITHQLLERLRTFRKERVLDFCLIWDVSGLHYLCQRDCMGGVLQLILLKVDYS